MWGGPKPHRKGIMPLFVYMCFITHTPPRFQIPLPKCILFFYPLLLKATEITPNKAKNTLKATFKKEKVTEIFCYIKPRRRKYSEKFCDS